MPPEKGYRVRQYAAPRELCERAAAELAETPAATETPGLSEYAPNETCHEIVRHVLEMHSADIAALKPEAKAVTINVAKLRKVEWSRISGSAGALYFVVALTRLDAASGWYTFLQQEESEPVENWKEDNVDLDPGDACIWLGESVGKPGEGEGGLMLVVMFR